MAGPQDEVPLEDIDKLLAEEDPEFAKSLEEVRAVEVDKNVVIEASAIDETEDSPATRDNESAGLIKRQIQKIRNALVAFRLGFKSRLIQFAKSSLVFLKTRPKEFLFFSFAVSKRGFKTAKVPLKAFAAAPRIYQLTLIVLVSVLVGAVWVLGANLKGIWIPHLMEPILSSLEDHADAVETYDPADGSESFYSAFPQELHEFLFKKMKVNLRRTSENPNPMGAFEVVVGVDSKDTAVELRDREVEFHDLLQRLFEDERVTDLDGETGKKILKGRIRKELNGKLTQGWIKEVHFETFVLKP
jgi:flagellar basal body-associated protein FliL